MSPIEIALNEIGKKENPIGSNWGDDVKKYLNSVGINFPAPWCAAFVYWCFKQVYGDKLPLAKTGGVLKMWNETPKKYRVLEPQTNDIVIFDYCFGNGHTGIVVCTNETIINTVEGNTNNNGSREGYEVCIRERIKSDKKIKGYIRIPDLENLC